METREQFIYMQVRIARMFAERLGLSLAQTAQMLGASHGFSYIADNWGLLHVEGDEAVYEDVRSYLARQEVL